MLYITSKISVLSIDVPSLFVPHVTSTSERSVTLVCQMTTSRNSPEVSDVFWTKDDRKIDIVRSGGKYSGGSITDPSLTIKAVNSNDGGRYQCCASNSVGNMWSETILLGKSFDFHLSWFIWPCMIGTFSVLPSFIHNCSWI